MQVFAGAMSESIPSSTTGFAHRRSRADSVTSFTYLEENVESSESSNWPDDEAVEEDPDLDVDVDVDEDDYVEDVNGVMNSALSSPQRRKSSGFSRLSAEDPLLHRKDSSKTEPSGYGQDGRTIQKIYIVTEDLTVVFAGFATSRIGYITYLIMCVATIGFGFLLFRWLPRWRVRLVGSPRALGDCSWVAVEVSSS